MSVDSVLEWSDVASARSRAPNDPPLPRPMGQPHYQSMVQRGLNPADYYNPNSSEYASVTNAPLANGTDNSRRFRLPATLVQVDDGSMASSSSASNALNFAGRASSGRFPDRNMFSADARTMQRDMVALVAGWLSENGFLSTALTLADEAGRVMTNDYHHRKMLRTVAKHVEEGAWEAAHKAIERCKNQNMTSKLGDGYSPEVNKGDVDNGTGRFRLQHVTCVDKGIAFILVRQQYLEYLEVGNTQQASIFFHKRVASFDGYIGEEHYQTLASLLACRSVSGDAARMYPNLFKDWTVAKGRRQIVAELSRQADESLNPCAYVSSLSPKPEAGELSVMVSEALSYRIIRNNPDLVSRLLSNNEESAAIPGEKRFTITSLLKASSLSGDVVTQLPPQRLLCCFDFNTARPLVNTSLHRYYKSLPYTTYFKESVHHEGNAAKQLFVHIDAPQYEGTKDTTSMRSRLTACAPLLSRSCVVAGTKSGEIVLMRIPSSPIGYEGDVEVGSCETLVQLPGRVWALDTAVLGPAQSGDFCRREIQEMLTRERLRPANGGRAEVFVGGVGGDCCTVLSLSSWKPVRTFINDGSSARSHRMLMSHVHKQRVDAASPTLPSVRSREDHAAKRDLLSIALFSPNTPNAGHSSTSTSITTNKERAELTRRKAQSEDMTAVSDSMGGDEAVTIEHCSGQQLLCAVGSEGGELILFDVFNGEQQYKLKAADSPIIAIEFSTCGNSIYAGYKNGSVLVIDTACGVVVRQFDPSLSVGGSGSGLLCAPQLQTEVCSTATSSNGALLAISYSSSTIHILDLASGLPLPIYLVGHNTSPKQQSRICFGATSRILVSASDDGFLCIWDLSDVLSDIDRGGGEGREGMTALMPARRIPLRMGSALAPPRYIEGSSGASALAAREHSRLLDATSDVKYDRVYDMLVVTTEDGKVFLAGP